MRSTLASSGSTQTTDLPTSAKDTAPGAWDLACAGHVAADEQYDDAVRRELEEELGLTRTAPSRLGQTVLDLPGETELCTIYALRHPGPFVLRPPELAALGV